MAVTLFDCSFFLDGSQWGQSLDRIAASPIFLDLPELNQDLLFYRRHYPVFRVYLLILLLSTSNLLLFLLFICNRIRTTLFSLCCSSLLSTFRDHIIGSRVLGIPML